MRSCSAANVDSIGARAARARRGCGRGSRRPGRSSPRGCRARRTGRRRSSRAWRAPRAGCARSARASSGCVERRAARPARSRRPRTCRRRLEPSANEQRAQHRLGLGRVSDRARTDGSRAAALGRARRCRRRRPRRAPLAPPRGTRSRRSPAGAPRRPRAVAAPGRAGGWRCGPSTAGRCARARRRGTTSTRIVPWQPGLDRAVGRLAEERRRRRRPDRDARGTGGASPLCTASTSSAS